MDWLNLHIPSVLRSPEYVGSSPAERGTWLCVMAYACSIECGGRLVGAALWKDRQWQQTCGVTLREVRSTARLLMIDGDDVVVNGYPVAKEAKVKQARGVGMAGAMARWGNADRHAVEHAETMPTGMPVANAEGEGEGEGKDKEKELVGTAAPSAPASGSGDLFGGIQQPATPPPLPATTKPKAPQQTDAEWLAGLSASPAYAGIDIAREHAKAAVWCQTKRKQLTRGRFVAWLNRVERPMAGTSTALFR